MSSQYQEFDAGHFNYDVTAIPGIPGERFRGPAVDPARPYIICLGAAQTFGRFCDDPFPAMLSRRLGIQVLNLGIGGVGPAFFDRPHYLQWLNGARLVVFQVLSGRSASNSAFDNRGTGSPTGIRVRDGRSMRFEDFMAEAMESLTTPVIRRLVEETRNDYTAAMLHLLAGYRAPTVLFWFSTRVPHYKESYSSSHRVMGAFPQLVNQAVLDRIAPACAAQAACVSQAGLPQRLWKAAKPVIGTDAKGGVLYNSYYPSPEMHLKAADVLEPVCRGLLAP